PKSSYRRFEADQPNECWQYDFTHWQLADGTGVGLINWLPRPPPHPPPPPRAAGPGLPHPPLTDNGSVYPSRFTGGRNGFEYLLAGLGIAQKNGHPNHPQTQGKIKRFHQPLKDRKSGV